VIRVRDRTVRDESAALDGVGGASGSEDGTVGRGGAGPDAPDDRGDREAGGSDDREGEGPEPVGDADPGATTDVGEPAALRVVTIDRPDARNALRPADLDELAAAVTDAPPVVYLHGAGEAFCAGADLDVVADLTDPAAFVRRGQRAARAIETAEAVVIAGIDGAARGGGVDLALACDLRVATPGATLAATGVRLGLFGAWGGTVRLPRVVGEGEALDLTLSGRTVDAAAALRMGLVSRVLEEPVTVAESIAARPADALRAVKRRVRDRSPVADQEAAEATAFARLHGTHAETIRAARAGRGGRDARDSRDDGEE
jgi:enoyl-CoA hydratase/carnithine racemase